MKINYRVGRLIIINLANPVNGRKAWNCLCDCGNYKVVMNQSLINKHTQSCGCYFLERRTTHGHASNGTRTGEYYSWDSMLNRCSNTNADNFHQYGGRGITVCERWVDSFENFLEDMGKRPFKNAQINRIDNEGNYEPSNCEWTTKSINCRNKRTSKFLTYDGLTLTLIEWSEKLGIHYETIRSRIRKGLSVNNILSQTVHDCGNRVNSRRKIK